MTETTHRSARPMTDDRELTAAEIDAFQREELFEDPSSVTEEGYPRVFNVSAAHIYRRVVRADAPASPEYVTVPLASSGNRSVDLSVAVAEWNLLWEAAQFRRRFFSDDRLPSALREVADRGDVNVVFVPRTATRYHEYSPLFHLLPRSTVERYGLPLLRAGQWPFLSEIGQIDRYLGVTVRLVPRGTPGPM